MESKAVKNYELKKHVGAVHCANQMSLLQRKIANALLYHAYDQLLFSEEHSIHISLLCELVGYKSHDYKTIKESLTALISTVIEWNLINKTGEKEQISWNASSIIASARIEGPICTYSYSKLMRELLYMPEYYARINLKIQSLFKSSYGLALYENCIRYQKVGRTPWIDLATFRKLMGVDANKYPEFKELKRRVIETAIKEVNQNAPITVFLQIKRASRKIVGIQFIINLKNHQEAGLDNDEILAKPTLAERLRQDFGFSDHQIKAVLLDYSENYILEKIALIEKSATFKAGKIVNLAKYLENALAQDYQPSKASAERLRKIDNEKNERANLEKQQQALQVAYTKYRHEKICDLVKNKLSQTEFNLLHQLFFEHLNKNQPLLANYYRKNGIENALVKSELGQFMAAKAEYANLLNSVMGFEEFVKSLGVGQFSEH